MQALARLPPAQGIAAMQSINVVVINPLFLTVFLGTAVDFVCATIASFRCADAAGGRLRAGGRRVLSLRWHVAGDDALQRAAERPRRPASILKAPKAHHDEQTTCRPGRCGITYGPRRRLQHRIVLIWALALQWRG